MDGAFTPGTLRLYAADPNPNGAVGCQLYLFAGDVTAAPIQNIELAPGVALPASSLKSNSPEFHLRIFHFNDLHGHLMRFIQGREEPVLPRVAWQIQSARQSCLGKPDTAVLVITAGDDSGGSIFDEIWMEKNPIHPGYQLYSKMGVDLAGLGNHDFDRGIPLLANAIREDARFPVLAANLMNCPALRDICHPAAILDFKGIRVGLIGLVTRAETRLDPDICQIVDPIPTAQNIVPAIRSLCDVLIIISHLGTSLEGSPVPMADAGDSEIARSLPAGSVDLIIGGHSHTVLNLDGLAKENIVNGIPIVQTGANGEYLGQVDIAIRQHSASVVDARLTPVASLPVDYNFLETEVRPLIIRVKDLWNQHLGQVDNNPDLSTDIVLRDFAKRESALANFVTDALVDRLTERGFLVDFAMIDVSTLHCGLPFSDNLTYGDCFEMMPYADTLRLYQITGRQLLDILADNALRVDRPGKPHAERGFMQFSREISYKIELGTTRSEAIVTDITVHDTPLYQLTEMIFTAATSCFARELASPWEAEWYRTHKKPLLNLHQFPYTETDILLRQEIIASIRESGGVTRTSGALCNGRVRIKSPEQDGH